MEWIKVKVKHAEYDFAYAPAEIFKAWIMMMIYVAATERIPTKEQLDARLGKDIHKKLSDYMANNGSDINTVISKVMEDVNSVNNQREHTRKYMSEYRGKAIRNTLCKALHKTKVGSKEEIRGDKRREDKRRAKLDFSFLEKQNIKNLIKLHGNKESVRSYLRNMGFYDVRITESFEKAGVI